MLLYFLSVLFCLASASNNCLDNSVFLKISQSNITSADGGFKILDQRPDYSSDSCNYVAGSECCECTNISGNYSLCKSLDDALSFIRPDVKQIYISINRSVNLRHSHHLNYSDVFILQGFGSHATIECDNHDTQLMINQFNTTTIDNIKFLNCGHGTLKLINNNQLELNKVTITNSQGTGLIVKFNKSDDIQFFFYPIHHQSYIITNCNFSHNGNRNVQGGGIHISVPSPIIVTIDNTTFENNTADIGGGLYYTIRHSDFECFPANVNVVNSLFYRNLAYFHGGAVHFTGTNGVFEGVNFTNNTSVYTGGGVYLFVHNTPSCEFTNKTILYKNCYWEKNVADGSSVLITETQSGVSPLNNKQVKLEDCQIEKNNVHHQFFFGQTSCTVFVVNVLLYLDSVLFLKNNGTAVCAQSTNVIFANTSKFFHNQGYLGGAVFVDDVILIFYQSANVSFISNRAVYGGAIYQNSLSAKASNETCLFTFEEDSNITFVHFEENSALSNGDTIYFLQPIENCEKEVFDSKVQFLPPLLNNSQISSEAYSIKLLLPVKFDENNQMYTLDVILGQKIVFNVTVLDYFNQSSYAQVTLLLTRRQYMFNTHNLYDINGFKQFTIASGINSPNIFITGSDFNGTDESYVLEMIGLHTTEYINLVLKECPLGFTYDEELQYCKCVSDSEVKCDYTLAKACISQSFWLGTIKGVIAAASCTTGYCQNVNGNCTTCPISGADNYCMLPPTEDDQCLGNRHGVLCAECKEDYAFTFGSVRCVPDSSCSKGQGIIPPLLNILFIVITFVAIIVILRFDYKLSSGYMFCFVYYFSIIDHILPSTTGETLLGIVSFFESFTQLNPQFLGFVPICFAPHFTALQQQVFLYVNPLIISIIVLLVVLLSKYCSKRFTFKDNTVIKAICLLLLLSFTSLGESSFNIFDGVAFEGIKGNVFVYIQPNTKYFDPKNHLPWFLVALLVMLILVIPFTLLLLLAPFLSRCVNLNKIKPFLDEFQGCYKDQYRWMAGYYFACRLFYFTILTIPSSHYVFFEYFLQLLSFFILVIHMLLQPYQNEWLNFTDSLLLADITLVALLYGKTAEIVFQSILDVKDIITYALIFVPVFYLIVIVVITIGKQFIDKGIIKVDIKSNKRNSWNTLREPLVSTSEVSVVNNRIRSLSASIGYRDPALSLLESEEHHNERLTSTTTSRPVTYSVLDSPTWLNERERTGTSSSQNWQNDNVGTIEENEDL